MLYEWAPGTRKKSVSKRFERMLNRFTDPQNRHEEKKKMNQDEDNAKYFKILTVSHAKSSVNMQKLERRMHKAEKE